MTQPASFVAPLAGSGVVQILCGVAVFLIDVIGMSVYGFSVPGLFTGLFLGIFYAITGSLTAAAARSGPDHGRCLALASLVLGILSTISSFGLWVWTAASLAGVSDRVPYTCLNGWPFSFCITMVYYYAPSLWGAEIAFLIIMFITSIVACVLSSRAMSTKRTITTVTTTPYATLTTQP